MLIFTLEEISNAPEHVKVWVIKQVMARLGGHVTFEQTPIGESATGDTIRAPEVVEPTPEVVEPTPEVVPGINLSDVQAKAKELAGLHGTDKLVDVLRKLGLTNISSCPEDRLAELLAEISIHV